MSDPDSRAGVAGAIARLASMPAFLETALARAGKARLATRPSGGGFSLVEHACHLRDLEREAYLVRVERMLAEDDPVLDGFAGDRIAAERDYGSQDAAAAARDFAAAREKVLGILGRLPPAGFARAGRFAGAAVTLAGLIEMAADHDAEHRRDIDRLLGELG